ncbi:Tannase/feruloyl esterase [Niveomyces insectorum RCEF 264]|uniref:Carboxylic ester hydrolase n=1 Tax=Niveomyces insectorum RCEF 264 TaxID=1081102 RepID=A0A167YU03_9HYPO|nr:Tannase/feruloyl esterase [Niveomyces insectorum RCEF 264]
MSSYSTRNLTALCTTAFLAPLFDRFTALETVVYHTANITATLVTNYTNTPGATAPEWPEHSGLNFCNVSLTYGHVNLKDNIINEYWLPDPAVYRNRVLTTGGAGWSSSGASSMGGGLSYGAVSAYTDGGFGGPTSTLNADILLAGGNGTIAWSALESYAFLANHELVTNARQLAAAFYNISSGSIKTYYFGCSEGGREGLKAIQTYPADYDGVIAAAPGINLPLTQPIQNFAAWTMARMNHFIDPCASAAIQRDIIAACDTADGLKDGVVSRPDLCTYNISHSIGTTWSNCTRGGPGAPTRGAVSEADARLMATLYEGPRLSSGSRVWYAYNLGIDWAAGNSATVWNNATRSFELGPFPYFEDVYQMFWAQTTAAPVINYTEVTTDIVYRNISSLLQLIGGWTTSTWPDLSAFQAAGGKAITWHGTQDQLLPTMMSAAYYENVRAHMFGANASYAQIQDFYRYFQVPGAAHCAVNPMEPHGPFPQYAVAQLIDWVENGVPPESLNGTTQSGSSTQKTICLWPSTPVWSASGEFRCETTPNFAETYIQLPDAWKIGTIL